MRRSYFNWKWNLYQQHGLYILRSSQLSATFGKASVIIYRHLWLCHIFRYLTIPVSPRPVWDKNFSVLKNIFQRCIFSNLSLTISLCIRVETLFSMSNSCYTVTCCKPGYTLSKIPCGFRVIYADSKRVCLYSALPFPFPHSPLSPSRSRCNKAIGRKTS
jgi:hypothetical protein